MKKKLIFLFFTLIIFILSILNISGKNYKILEKPEISQYEYTDSSEITHNTYSTAKITLTKGTYKFIINYTTSKEAKIEACTGRTAIAEGLLEINPDSGYHVMDLTLDKSTSEFYFRITDPEDLNIYNYEIIKNGYIVYDDIYYSILILLGAFILFFILNNYWNGKYDLKKVTTIFTLIGITVFLGSPVFNEYLIYGFDIEFHLSRIEGIKDAFLDGQLIPTIYPNCNNGYGVLGFMYPGLFLVPSALLRLCDVSMVASYHFFILLINALTVFVAWVTAKTFTRSDKTALICVLICACNPLRLISLYQSAAVGESIGMTFMPLVFAGLYEIIYGDKKKWYYLTIAFTSLMMSHILSCVITLVVSLVIILLSLREIFDKENKRYKQLILSIAVFFLINSWYMIKFIMFYSYSLNNEVIFSNHYYKDTVIPTKYFMMSTTNMVAPQAEKGILDGCMQGPGITGLICIFVMILDAVVPNPEDKKQKKWNIICLMMILTTMYIGSSAFPWYKTTEIKFLKNFMGTVQFPHRFYMEILPVIFILAPISVEKIVSRDDSVKKNIAINITALWVVMGIFSIISAYTVMDAYNIQAPFKDEYSGGYASYPLMEYLPRDADTSMFNNTEPHNFGSVTLNYEQNGTSAAIECKTYDEGAYVLLPMLYYPGYSAIGDDGTEYMIDRSEDGRIRIFMPVKEEPLRIYIYYNAGLF